MNLPQLKGMSILSPIKRRIREALPDSFYTEMLRKMLWATREDWKFQNGLVTMMGSIHNLTVNGFAPRTVLDIGAYVGEWTTTVSGIMPNARFHMVEAQPEKRPRLEAVTATLNGRATFSMTLLGPEPRENVIFHTAETGSSVFVEQTSIEKKPVPLTMRTLDDVVMTERLEGPFFIKLDVQGYELEVLKGASKALANTEVILMELALLEYNAGAPLIDEVIAFMSARGFFAYDFCGQARRQSDGALFQADMIFAQKDSPLRARKKFFNTEN